jgi:hypothetical protein
MATSDSFLMDSLSDSLLAAVTETSFHIPAPPPVAGKFSHFVLQYIFINFNYLEKLLKPIAELNLSPAITACYQRSGISHLFSWQADCLEKANASGEYIHLFQFHSDKAFFYK